MGAETPHYQSPREALYREAQLALRAVVGVRDLDAFLTDKNAIAGDIGASEKGDRRIY